MKANLVFNKQPSNDNSIVYDVNGVIGDSLEGIAAKDFAKYLQANKTQNITLRINSPGGLVSDALQIYDLLSQHDGKVTTEVYGATASAATIISQAGRRKMSANALMLVHHAWSKVQGNKYALAKGIEDLEKFDQRIKAIYLSKGIKPKDLEPLMAENEGDGRWIDANEALSYGLIDEILPESMAKAEIDMEMIKALSLPTIPTNKVTQHKVIEMPLKVIRV